MKKDFLPPDVKTLLPTIGILLVIIFVGIISVNIGLSQISKQTSKIKELKQEESVLTEKQTILSEIQGNILAQADMAIQVLPDTNPALAIISQLRALAIERSLSIEGINTGVSSSDGDGFSRVNITIDVNGPATTILDYALTLKRIAPLVSVSDLRFASTTGATESTLIVNGYWSPLPKEIASVSQPINSLTADEEDLLNEFSGRLFPSFVVSAPAEPVQRDNPFN